MAPMTTTASLFFNGNNNNNNNKPQEVQYNYQLSKLSFGPFGQQPTSSLF